MATNAQQQKVKAAALEKIQARSVGQMADEAEPADGPEQYGIQDLLEVLLFVEVLAETVIEAVADGISPMDAVAIFSDEEVRDALGPAADDISDVGLEVTDLSPSELRRIFERLVDMAFSIYDTVTSALVS